MKARRKEGELGNSTDLEDRRGGEKQLRGLGQLGNIATKCCRDSLSILVQAVGRRCDVGQRQLPGLLKHANLLLDVAEVQRIVEAAHDVSSDVSQLEHLAQLLQVAGDEVQEAEPVKALGLLVAELDNLVVALAEGFEAWGEIRSATSAKSWQRFKTS